MKERRAVKAMTHADRRVVEDMSVVGWYVKFNV